MPINPICGRLDCDCCTEESDMAMLMSKPDFCSPSCAQAGYCWRAEAGLSLPFYCEYNDDVS